MLRVMRVYQQNRIADQSAQAGDITEAAIEQMTGRRADDLQRILLRCRAFPIVMIAPDLWQRLYQIFIAEPKLSIAGLEVSLCEGRNAFDGCIKSRVAVCEQLGGDLALQGCMLPIEGFSSNLRVAGI